MNKITQRGFSLVEMLMALLVASLLMAALAPVITRKMHSEQIDISAKGDLSEKKVCGYVNDTFEDIKAEDCTAPNDAHFGSAIIVSGGGGGGGAVDTVISANKVLTYKGPTAASNTVSQSQYEFEFNKNINTIFIRMAAGGGGGGGGNYNANFAGASSGCEKITGTDTTGKSSYAAYDNINKLCVTKYNQVSNPSDYTTYTITDWTDTKCTSNYSHTGRCNANKNNMAYVYSGCNRPVCTHAGAEAACTKLANNTGLNWRLPNKNELKSLSHAKFAMCTSASSGTMFNLAAYCNHSDNYVYNSVGGSGLTEMLYFHAHPYEVWTKEAYATNNYWGGSLQTYWDVFPFLTGWPLSVRCVADSQYNLFTGGGGGGSSLMTIYIPQEVIKYVTGSANTGLIKIYAGAGGKGGAKQSTVRGSAGSPSRVEVYAKHASSGGRCKLKAGMLLRVQVQPMAAEPEVQEHTAHAVIYTKVSRAVITIPR